MTVPADRPFAQPSRRSVATGVAWGLPALAVGAAAPSFAGSTDGAFFNYCPPVDSLSITSAYFDNDMSYSLGEMTTELYFYLKAPCVPQTLGESGCVATPFPFDANPYYHDSALFDGAENATPFPITGVTGYQFLQDGFTRPTQYQPFRFLMGDSAGQATTTAPQGSLSFHFQIGYQAVDANGYQNDTSRPVPTIAYTYCDYYFNGTFDAAGQGSGLSVTSSPLYT